MDDPRCFRPFACLCPKHNTSLDRGLHQAHEGRTVRRDDFLDDGAE